MTSNSVHTSPPRRSKLPLILVAIALLAAGTLAVVRWGRVEVASPPGISDHIVVDAELRAEVARLHGDIERSPRSAALRLELAMVLHANELAGLALDAYE